MKKFLLIYLVIFLCGTTYGNCLSIKRGKRFVGNENPCSLPPDAGMCFASFSRYFYNSTSRRCDTFIYGGCGGNENNFRTSQQCMATCGGTVRRQQSNSFLEFELDNPLELRDDCESPKDSGFCFASIRRFYFNGVTCENFIYGGCGGNRNNFRTREECTKKCAHKLDFGSGETEEDFIFSLKFG